MRNDIVAKIAKLERLAANPGTPAEGEAARLKAQMLRDKYGIGTAPSPSSGARERQGGTFVAPNGVVWTQVAVFTSTGTSNPAEFFWNFVNEE